MAPNLSKIKGIARRSPHYTFSPTVNGTVYVDLKTSSKSRFSTYNAENGLLVNTK